MINFWDKHIGGRKEHEFEIYAINYLNEDWQGGLKLSINDGSGTLSSREHEISIPAAGRVILNAEIPVPAQKGAYRIIAGTEVNGQPVLSIRDLVVGELY